MAKRNLKSILVRMPTTLKRRLAREVARRESTLNDVAVEILAAEFGVEFMPSGRRAPAPGETGVVLLRVPPELKRQLDAAARERRTSTNKIIVESLAERLDAPTPRKDTMPETAVRTVRREARTRFASRSSASATAPTRSSRESSTTRTHPRTSSSPA